MLSDFVYDFLYWIQNVFIRMWWSVTLSPSINHFFGAKSKGQRTIRFRMGHDTWLKRGWKFFVFFVRPLVVGGKCLKIFNLGKGESTVLLKTNREMLLTYYPKNNLWLISESVNGDRKVSHVSSSYRINWPFWCRFVVEVQVFLDN